MLCRKEAKIPCSYLINGVTLLTFSHFHLEETKRNRNYIFPPFNEKRLYNLPTYTYMHKNLTYETLEKHY